MNLEGLFKRAKETPGFAMAVQAVCALLAIEAISRFAGLERIYWAEIGATMVICQSFGESLKKSLRRALATLLGASAGALACHALFMLEAPDWLRFALAFCGAMTALRCYPERYQAYVFWLCFAVILLLDVSGRRGEQLAFVRVYEAALGSLCGALASFLILPVRSRERAAKAIASLRDGCKPFLAVAREAFAGEAPPSSIEDDLKGFDAQSASAAALLEAIEAEEAVSLPDEGAAMEKLSSLRAFREQLSSLFQRLPFPSPPEKTAALIERRSASILNGVEALLDGSAPASELSKEAGERLRQSFREEAVGLLEGAPELKRASAPALEAMYWLFALRESAAACGRLSKR